MRILRKALVGLALVLCFAMLLTGCEGFLTPPTNDPDNNGSNNTNTPPDTEKTAYTIICNSSDIDLLEVRSKLIEIQGTVSTVADTTELAKNEIVVGDTSRDITAKAKSELASLIEKSAKYDSGYIIYSDGDNVAVYWALDTLEEEAVSAFVENCIVGNEIRIPAGVIDSSLCDSTDAQWDAITEKCGEDMARALRNLHAYYEGPKIAGWVANLYDPEIGGFYYSRSARDYEGFLPDIESTSQAISVLATIGAIPTSKVNEMLPDEIKAKIVNFIRDLQAPEDGYYYHPQWPYGKENLQTDRYGRDVGSATSVIAKLTYDSDGDGVQDVQRPKYCALGGHKCDLHAGTDKTCTFPIDVDSVSSISSSVGISRPLATTASAAVSKLNDSVVHATASVSSHPDYSSAAAFLKWLEAYNANIHVNSGGAHNLAAIRDEIKAHGYADVLINHLNQKQKELFDEQEALGEDPSGIWQRAADYRAVWGVYKYMYIFNDYNEPIDIKYAPYMIRTCLKVVALPADGRYAYNDLMNQWGAINGVISNISRHYGADEAKKLYDIVREDPVGLIENSLQKMLPFKQEDGSFSNNVNGTTSASIYGVPIALGGVAEGNVNSTHILLGMYTSICTALNCPRVALCDLDDGWDAVETMVNADPIEKIELEKTVFDFESGELSDSIFIQKNNSDANLEIVDDPTGDSIGSLYFYSPSSTNAGDTVNVSAAGVGGNAYVFYSDIYIDSTTGNGTIMQLNFTNTYMLQFKKTSSGIVIQDASSINGDNVHDLATVSLDEWFNIYIEYYASGDGENHLELPMIKIWVNGEYVTTTSNFYGSHKPGANPVTTCTGLAALALRSPIVHAYFDNIYLARETLTFDDNNNNFPLDE